MRFVGFRLDEFLDHLPVDIQAKKLRVSYSSLYRWRRRGEVPRYFVLGCLNLFHYISDSTRENPYSRMVDEMPFPDISIRNVKNSLGLIKQCDLLDALGITRQGLYKMMRMTKKDDIRWQAIMYVVERLLAKETIVIDKKKRELFRLVKNIYDK